MAVLIVLQYGSLWLLKMALIIPRMRTEILAYFVMTTTAFVLFQLTTVLSNLPSISLGCSPQTLMAA